MNTSMLSALPAIRRLRVERFRGIRLLEWHPDAGLNVIVGPADACKSTILEAISLLLTPATNVGLSEFDYFQRESAKEFRIEAVIAIDSVATLRDQETPHPPLRGWVNHQLTDLPDDDGSLPVLVCQLTGKQDLEPRWEILGAGEVRVPLTRALRQKLGVIRLWVGDRGERDLRLVQGGALDRFLDGRALRQAIVRTVMQTKIHDALGEEPRNAVGDIEKEFKLRNLPHPVRLGLVGTPGVSLAASVGLTVGDGDDTALPLVSWGSGTRRLAALQLASLGISAAAIALVDEPETGLEPYRQRAFIAGLCSTDGRQALVTTHSPAVLASAMLNGAIFWRANATASSVPKAAGDSDVTGQNAAEAPSHVLYSLASGDAYRLVQSQPEALVARVPVVCEGCTEVGFGTRLFESRFGSQFHNRGIVTVDAGGHFKSLPICEDLLRLGFSVAAIVDDEGKKAGTWARLSTKATLLRWRNGASLERAVIGAFSDHDLCEMPQWVEVIRGRAAVHQIADVRRLLGITEKLSAQQLLERVGRARFLEALCNAACPKAEGNSKPRGWFKTFDGGYLLAEKLLASSPRPQLLEDVETFLSAVETLTSS